MTEARAESWMDARDQNDDKMPEIGANSPDIASLSLGEALGRLIARPASTWQALRETLFAPPARVIRPASDAASVRMGESGEGAADALIVDPEAIQPGAPIPALPAAARSDAARAATAKTEPVRRSDVVIGCLVGLAALVALVGSAMVNTPEVRASLDLGAGGGLFLVALLAVAIVIGVGVRFARLPKLEDRPRLRIRNVEHFLGVYGLKLTLVGPAALLTLGAWMLSTDNRFTDMGLVCWILSIACWFGVLLDRRAPFGFSGVVDSARRMLSGAVRLRWSWTATALAAILLAGAYFRFSNLSGAPPDMTSDHVEMALDAHKILTQGLRAVFFPNNGGREGFHMYYLAALKQITGLPISFELLKIGSGLQGMLMILLSFWLGRAIFGDEDRALGNLVGLAMAGMVATSYWETILSRLGERIALTAVITTLVVIFLARGMRHNRRLDFLLAGLALGAGMYFYQAVRMVPVVVVAGVFLAVALRARSWQALLRYVINFTALVIISAVVFVPLARYWMEYPTNFWERTGGRLFGEDTIQVKDNEGNVIGIREPTPEERTEAFQKNITVLFDNYRKAALMFNVRGDNAWITGDPNGTPQLDLYTGAFFILGLGMVIARIVRRRDPVDVLLPVGVLIMILPTALSIAYVIEVPSATRASGALPFVYLIAGLGLALTVQLLVRALPWRAARRAVYGGAALVIVLGAFMNSESYFVNAMTDYRNSTFPYRQAGTMMRGFIDSTGAPGNVFMIAWDYWWDHRALAIESGDPDWNNGVLRDNAIDRIKFMMAMNNDTRYELQPDRQLMFFIHQLDEEMLGKLEETFPGGSAIHVTAFNPDRDFQVYVAPPVGCAWARANLNPYPRSCE